MARAASAPRTTRPTTERSRATTTAGCLRRARPSSSRRPALDADVVAQAAAQQTVEHFVRPCFAHVRVRPGGRSGAHAFVERVSHRAACVQVDEQVREQHEEHERQPDGRDVLHGREAAFDSVRRRASPDELAADPLDDVDAELLHQRPDRDEREHAERRVPEQLGRRQDRPRRAVGIDLSSCSSMIPSVGSCMWSCRYR